MRKMRVLVLMHEKVVPPKSIENLTPAQINPFKQEFDVIEALESLGHEVIPLGVGDELLPIRQAVEDAKPHIAFNLLTHFHRVGIYASYVVSYLELLKVPYTGCNARGLLLADDKVLAKKILAWHRIPMPKFAVFRRERAIKEPVDIAAYGMEYPLFVKSGAEDSSYGIAQASIVSDARSLVERVRFVHQRIGTDALVEKYIEGRELYVSVLGNRRLQTFPIWELTFENLPAGTEPIATDKVKWDLAYQKKLGVMSGPAEDIDEALRRRIHRVCKRVYRALELSGYARIDLRLAEDGEFFFLEANPNADLSHGDEFADGVAASGIEYPELIQRMLSLGMRYSPAWKESS